jgi:hypothetical protein
MIHHSNKKFEPLADVYCRGCHARPSFKNISTYLCEKCWDRWNEVRRSARALEDSEVDAFKEELTAYIKNQGRDVWQQEAYLYLSPVSAAELKKNGIKVATICRELGLFPPVDDRITKENSQRVREFTMEFFESHKKTPSVREVMAGIGMDHTTLWSCMDFEEFVRGLGGKVDTDVRFRFPDDNAFLQAAAQVVREADCPLHMTAILDEMGVSYPTYLDNFKAVTSKKIHNAAGVSRSHKGLASLLEMAGEKALTELGWKVERQASFPDLVGKKNKPLLYDFRLVGTNTLVEIDGPQHYNPNDTYFKKSVKKGDDMKNEYAMRNGYPLVRVDARVHKSPKTMKAFLLPRIGYGPRGPLNPSNSLNTTGPARRGIVRGETRGRPNRQ